MKYRDKMSPEKNIIIDRAASKTKEMGNFGRGELVINAARLVTTTKTVM